MLGQIFVVIEFLMKLIGLWDSFINWSDKRRIAQAEIDEQARTKALDELKHATTEDEFDKAQDAVVGARPKP